MRDSCSVTNRELRVTPAQAVSSPMGVHLTGSEHPGGGLGAGNRVCQEPPTWQAVNWVQGPARKSRQEQKELGPESGLVTQHTAEGCNPEASYLQHRAWVCVRRLRCLLGSDL